MMAVGDPSTLLEGFIRHVQALAQDDSYQYLKGVLDENSTLKDRNHILNITNEENHRAISRLQQHLDEFTKRGEDQDEEINTLTQEKVFLDAKIALFEFDAESTRVQLENTSEELLQLQTQLQDKSTELDSATSELKETAEECSRLKEDVADRESDIDSLKASLEEEQAAAAARQAAHEEAANELQSTRDELESKKTSLEETTDELQLLKAELEVNKETLDDSISELQSAREDLETLKVGLEEKQSALATLEAAHDLVETELRSTQQDLEGKNTRLGELNALSYKMKSPPQDQTHQQLHSMFSLAYNWAENLFIGDLEEKVFITPTSSTIWAKIRVHGRVNRIIPLPLSNTREAKQMRICAVLAIVAWALAQYIFQPTYLLQCNELSDLLDGLADDDPVREHYLRSVLLPVSPSRQKANGKKRIEQVVVEVMACISPVFPSSRHEELRGSLETICKSICGQWMRLQLLDEKVEPSFDAYDEEDWKMLNLPPINNDDEGGAALGIPATESAIVDDDRYQAVGDIEDISAVLWPSFLSFRGGESELLTEGFVLNKAQVKPAFNEEKAALLQGIHRAARQMSRKDRTKSFVTNGEDMSIKAFLPLEPEDQSVDIPHDEPVPELNESENGQTDGAQGC